MELAFFFYLTASKEVVLPERVLIIPRYEGF
jgi:hypothetical protein